MLRAGQILVLAGYHCWPHPSVPPTVEAPASLVPGLALLCCEGCDDGHVATVIQQHVCKLHQAVDPGVPTVGLAWYVPGLGGEGL